MLFESCCAFVQCIAMFSAFLPVHSAHIAEFTAYGAEQCCVAGNDQYRRIHYNDISVSHYNDTTPPLHYSNTGPWLEWERSGWDEDGIKKIKDTPPLPPFSWNIKIIMNNISWRQFDQLYLSHPLCWSLPSPEMLLLVIHEFLCSRDGSSWFWGILSRILTRFCFFINLVIIFTNFEQKTWLLWCGPGIFHFSLHQVLKQLF